MNIARKLVFFLLTFSYSTTWGEQTETQTTAADLIELDFEELVNMDVEVQSAGKSSTRVMELPYAAYVISAHDIASSGAQTVPDALRLAPGVTVSQISTAEWSVAIRGQGGRFSRHVLVMVDGRSVYNLVFSGVNWDELNLSMGEIEKIEVIRGPNAAAWGANAVNGIINIITRRAHKGRPSNIDIWAGGNESAGFSAGTVFELPGDWTMGLSGHSQKWGGLESENGQLQEDEHSDWRLSTDFSFLGEHSDFRFSATAFESKQSPYWSWLDPEQGRDIITDTNENKAGWALQGVLKYKINSDVYLNVRTSTEETLRDSNLYQWNSSNYQVDAEIAARAGKHQLSGGVNTRFNKTELFNAPYFLLVINTPRSETNSYGLFLSDVIEINKDFQLSIAARYDNSELIDAEIQPSVRLLWRVAENSRLWFASSEASSTPSLALMELKDVPYALLPANPPELPLPLAITLSGNSGEHKSTHVQAFEIGYRQTFERLNIDFSVFNFDYRDELNITQDGEPTLIFTENPESSYLQQKTEFVNNKELSTIGGELSFHMQLQKYWNAQLNLSIIETDDTSKNKSSNVSFHNQLNIREKYHWNIWFKYSHNNRFASAQFADIDNPYGEPDNYAVLDTSLQWTASEHLRFELLGKNIGKSHTEAIREEFSSPIMLIEPSAMLKISFSY
ncbi:iron complex outermembrane recepter protein [Alteromonadaceae bacterium Bs31]|nr:iron complex outermembrane recepter protein [Alteromonadaceae bacterium Bs31]